MCSVRVVTCAVISGGLCLSVTAERVHAACKTMEASHNGTDMFHETGAGGAAINKLLGKVENLKAVKSAKRVQMGRVYTKCGPWFEKYLLPHRHCVARARVCY